MRQLLTALQSGTDLLSLWRAVCGVLVCRQHWPIIVVSVIAMLLARFANIYPNAYLINKRRKPEKQIPFSFQHIMWFSGLRGAIAFALALQAFESYSLRNEGLHPKPGAGLCILTMTLSIVIFTVLSMGGAIFSVMLYFDTPECTVFEKKIPTSTETEEKHDAGAKAEKASGFLKFDRKYFKPLFTWRYQDEEQALPADLRDPRWSATNVSGLGKRTSETVARPVDGVEDARNRPTTNPEDDSENSSLLSDQV